MEGRIQIIKYAPPPPELPTFGKGDPKNISFIGRTNYVAALEEKKYIFGINRADRRRPVYVIGKSGSGKTKLLELMIRQDIAEGYGLCLIDPQGDLFEDILSFVPAERARDVVVIDPLDAEFPVAFNPFADVSPDERHELAQRFTEIMAKQFGSAWTPRVEQIVHFSCLALLDNSGSSLKDLLTLLTDADFRKRIASNVEDLMVRRFWAEDFNEWAMKYEADTIIPLINKLRKFLLDPLLKNIFESKENKIDFDRLLAEQKIILIHLVKGRLGEETAGFFGSLLIMKLKQAGMARAMLSEKERRDLYFYCDGFESLVTPVFENLLAEGGKYGFCFTLANQHAGQLAPAFMAEILSRAGTLVVFRMGGDDAIRFKAEMAPVFEAKDMMSLGSREFYIKMMIDGEPYDPFSAETLKVIPAAHASAKELILKASRASYSMPPVRHSEPPMDLPVENL